MGGAARSAKSSQVYIGTRFAIEYYVKKVLTKQNFSDVYVVSPCKIKRIATKEAVMKVNLPQEIVWKRNEHYRDRRFDVKQKNIREARFLKHLVHPHIARYMGTATISSDGVELEGILMDYHPGSITLRDFIKAELKSAYNRVRRAVLSKKQPMKKSEECFRELETLLDNFLAVKEVLDDVSGYLRSEGVVHQDIKPENILVEVDKKGRINRNSITIIDFGSAYYIYRKQSDPEHKQVGWGDTLYAPPARFLEHPKADNNRDNWSIAIVLYEMLTGRHLLSADNNKEEFKHAVMQKLTRQLEIKRHDEAYSGSGIDDKFKEASETLSELCRKVKAAVDPRRISRAIEAVSEIDGIGRQYMAESFSFAAACTKKSSQ